MTIVPVVILGNQSKMNIFISYNFQNDTTWNVSKCTSNCSAPANYNLRIYLDAFCWGLVGLYTFTFFVGLIGNSLVCFAVWRNKNMRTVTNIFLVNLAAADLGVIIICLPPALVADVTDSWFFGNVFCKIHIFLSTTTIAVSVMTLCAISVERWYAICHPLHFHSTVQRARIIIVGIWSVSVIVALPESIWAAVEYRRNDTSIDSACFPALMSEEQIRTFQITLMVVFYFVPICLMGYTYTNIAVVLSKKRIPGINYKDKQLNSRESRLSDVKDQLEGRRKAARMLVAVVILFAVCFLPSHVLNIIRYSVGLHIIPHVTIVALLAHWIMFFNSCINPIIYNFFSGKFREEFKLALKICIGCRTKKHIRNSEVLRMTLYSGGRSTIYSRYNSNRRSLPGYRSDIGIDTVQIQDKLSS